MPLNEEQQAIRDELAERTQKLAAEIPGYESFTRQAAALNHLKTGGVKPDFSRLTDREVGDIFDAGRLNPSINGLGDVDLEHRFGQINLQEKGITSARGPDSVPSKEDIPASRQYMEEAINTWMEHENNALNPRLIFQAQMGIADSPGVVLGGKLEKASFDYMHLQDSMKASGQGDFHDPQIEASLAQLKTAELRFGAAAKEFREQALNQAAREGLEFAAKMQVDPRRAAYEVRECGLLDGQNPPDISGADLSGLDLSESDFSGLKIDAETLSRANGLDTVKGVEPKILAGAQGIKQHTDRLADLTQRLEKLENKGGVMDNLRNIRHGGVKGERDHIQKEMEKAQSRLAETRQQVALQQPGIGQALASMQMTEKITAQNPQTPPDYAKKMVETRAQAENLMTQRERVAALPDNVVHPARRAQVLGQLDQQIGGLLGSMRNLSAHSGALNQEKIAHLKDIQELATRFTQGSNISAEAKQGAEALKGTLQSEIFTRQAPGFDALVLGPEHRDYEDSLGFVEQTINGRQMMGAMIYEDLNKVLNREPDTAIKAQIQEKTAKLREQTAKVKAGLGGEAAQKAAAEINAIRMGSSDTIQGKSGGGEKEGGADQATQNWQEAAALASSIAQSGRPINLEDMREINRVLNKNLPANDGVPGEFRAKTETAGGRTQYPYPEHIPQLMDEFTEWMEQNQDRDPIELSGMAYQKLVSIHPFDDANGRTCRLVVDSILESKGLPPASYQGSQEVNVAVFAAPQGDMTNITPDEAIQRVAKAVERSQGILAKHSLGLQQEAGVEVKNGAPEVNVAVNAPGPDNQPGKVANLVSLFEQMKEGGVPKAEVKAATHEAEQPVIQINEASKEVLGIENEQPAVETAQQAVRQDGPDALADLRAKVAQVHFPRDNDSDETLAERARDLSASLQALDEIASPDPQTHIAGVVKLMSAADSAEVGQEIAKVTMQRADAQQVAKEIGKQSFRAEILKASRPNEFLRSDHALNGFTKEYLKENSPNYTAGVQAAVAESAQRLGIEALKTSPDKMAQKQAAVALGGDMITAITQTPMDPAADDYLAGFNEVANNAEDTEIQEHLALKSKQAGYRTPVTAQELGQTMVNNAKVLRLGCDSAVAAAELTNPVTRMAASGVQKVSNACNDAELDQISLGSVADVANSMHTPENRLAFAEMHGQLGVQNQALVADLKEQVAAGPHNLAMQRINNLALDESMQQEQAAVQAVDAEEAPAPQVQQEQSRGRRSVRDMLRGAAGSAQAAAQNLKNIVANKLDDAGNEQRLRDVDKNTAAKFKQLQKELTDLNNAGGKALDKAMNGQVSALNKLDATKEARAVRIGEIKEQMQQMKQENPGLGQLERSSVGQSVHSAARGAAKAVASKVR